MDDIFVKFKNLKVGIIGDVMIDKYLWGDVDRISPEAPIPVVAVTNRETRLGGAANVALNVKTLGATPIIFTVVGKDDESNILFQLLEQHQISSQNILRSEDRTTTIKTRILARNQQMFRYDSEMTTYINDETSTQLIAGVKNYINEQQLDVVIFQDYNKGILTQKVIEEVISLCNEKDIPTVVDPKKHHFLSYKNCTLFKPNLRETMDGLGVDIDPSKKESLTQASLKLEENLNNKITLFTLSDKGMFVSEGTSKEHIPAHVRDVSDVSGAGDTVISVIALCLALQLNILFMAKLANIAGGLVCEEVGVVPVTIEKLKDEAGSIEHK